VRFLVQVRANPPEAWLWLAVGIVAGLDMAMVWTIMLAATSHRP
jgi:hypothetical protein